MMLAKAMTRPNRATRPLARVALAALFAITALALGAQSAAAQDTGPAACTFLEIKADSGSGGVDSKLSALKSKLEKPPFSAWKHFELVAKHSRKLAHMKAEEVALKAGGKLTALFRQLSKSAGKKDRLSLSLTLDDKRGKRALDSRVHVDAGDYFVIVVGQSDSEGHLLAFTCSAK